MRGGFRGHSPAATLGLGVCLALSVAIGVSYARTVPPFNNPDEPAHWNFVVHLATTGQLPVLRPGDYPQALVEQLKSARFPPGVPVDSIVYESHQPPLYYALAALVYKAAVARSVGAAFFAVRLLTVLFGAALVAVTYLLARKLEPSQPALWVGASAVVALLPMHANIIAAVDNDALGDLLLATLVLLCLVRAEEGWSPRLAVGTGAVLGLGLLTKVTVFAGIPLLVLTEAIAWWRGSAHGRAARVRGFSLAAVTAALIAGWWPVRNVAVYGIGDPLGLERNKEVVTQPLTGPVTPDAATRWATITFDSFWGQFGWMGIPLDERIYRVLALATVLATLGVAVASLRRAADPKADWGVPVVLGAWLLLVVGDDIYYNLTFIQAQGRYLFPALPVFAMTFSGGFLAFLRPRARWLGVIALAASMLLLNTYILRDVLWPYFHR